MGKLINADQDFLTRISQKEENLAWASNPTKEYGSYCYWGETCLDDYGEVDSDWRFFKVERKNRPPLNF